MELDTVVCSLVHSSSYFDSRTLSLVVLDRKGCSRLFSKSWNDWEFSPGLDIFTARRHLGPTRTSVGPLWLPRGIISLFHRPGSGGVWLWFGVFPEAAEHAQHIPWTRVSWAWPPGTRAGGPRKATWGRGQESRGRDVLRGAASEVRDHEWAIRSKTSTSN